MHTPIIRFVQCFSPAGLHHMAYKEWGDPANPRILVCVHGVTRVGDDFDELAQALAGQYRVICPDVVGRGRSGRLPVAAMYQLPQYVSDMVTLLAQVLGKLPQEAQQVDWLGTSMGGLIGLGLAAQRMSGISGASLPAHASLIRKLILNDIGPSLNLAAVQRIAEYIGQDLVFATYDEGVRYIRTVSATFGPHTDAQWDKLARDVLRQQSDGTWKRHYDIALAAPFKATTLNDVQQGEALLWAAYDAVRCPTLVIRGAESDLLSRETAAAMTQRGPKASLIELPGIGHAPSFVHPGQIALVEEFLHQPL